MKTKPIICFSVSLVSLVVLLAFWKYHKLSMDNTYDNLYKAIRNDNLNDVKNAINRGADVNLTNSDNFGSLLSLAVISNKIDIVKYLLANKADINQVDNSESTPFIIAAARGYLPILKVLYKNKADINVKCEYGRNALIWAAFGEGNVDVIAFLLKLGIDINSRDNNNNNALYWAVYMKNYKAAQFLIEQGIDTNVINNSGFKTLDILKATDFRKLSLEKQKQYQKVSALLKNEGAQGVPSAKPRAEPERSPSGAARAERPSGAPERSHTLTNDLF